MMAASCHFLIFIRVDICQGISLPKARCMLIFELMRAIGEINRWYIFPDPPPPPLNLNVKFNVHSSNAKRSNSATKSGGEADNRYPQDNSPKFGWLDA